jgi:hypothetical protein
MSGLFMRLPVFGFLRYGCNSLKIKVICGQNPDTRLYADSVRDAAQFPVLPIGSSYDNLFIPAAYAVGILFF